MKKELFYVPEDTSWTAFSNELTEKYGLTVSGVYAKLLDVCPRGTTTVTVRQKWLAEKLHLTTRTVIEALKTLEEIGLIAKTKNSRASTYEIKPIINLKGRLDTVQTENYTPEMESPSKKRTSPLKRISRKKPFRTPEEERERQIELDKYLDLIN
jgi:hypothetical protein